MDTGELGAAAGVGAFPGVVPGFLDCDCVCDVAGAGFVCAAAKSALQHSVAGTIARIKVANRFEKSDTVPKNSSAVTKFQPNCRMSKDGAARFRTKIRRISEHTNQAWRAMRLIWVLPTVNGRSACGALTNQALW